VNIEFTIAGDDVADNTDTKSFLLTVGSGQTIITPETEQEISETVDEDFPELTDEEREEKIDERQAEFVGEKKYDEPTFLQKLVMRIADGLSRLYWTGADALLFAGRGVVKLAGGVMGCKCESS